MKRFRQRLAASCGLVALAVTLAACSDILGGERGAAPKVMWRTPHEPQFTSSDEDPATDGERLYATPGGIVAYDAHSGAILWTRSLDQTVPTNLLVRHGRLLGAEGAAFAIDAATGQELWRFDQDGHSGFSDSAADDQFFYIGSNTHRVYALDQASGAMRWTRDIGPDWEHFGVVTGLAVSGDTLYASAEQYNAANGHVSTGWIVALDRATGGVLWSYRNGSGDDWRTVFGSVTVAGRLLLAADLRGNSFFAVDRFTGLEVWRRTGARDMFGPRRAPVVVGSTAYVASNDMHVYAVDVATGRLLWKTRTPASNHAFAVCGERIFVGWLGLSVLDRATGRVLYESEEGIGDYPTSGFAVHGDRVFVLGNRAAYAYRCR